MTFLPVAVNYLDAATWAESVEDPAITPGKMEGGYVTSRPRFTRTPRRTFTFQFQMMSDKTNLENFYNTNYGSAGGFNITHPITSAVINVRFDNAMKLKFSRMGFGPINIWQTDTIILTEI